MPDDRAKTPRTLLVADHLWDTFSIMAVEMGSDRDSLINQALHTFARLNGFLVASDVKKLAQGAPSSAVSQPIESSRPRPQPGPPTMVPPAPVDLRPHGNPERVAEIAQQLGSPPPRPVVVNAPVPLPPPVKAAPEASLVEVDDSLLGEEGQAATSMDLPGLASSLGGVKQPVPTGQHQIVARHTPAAEAVENGAAKTLILLAEGRELDRVVKDRFLIGRGKHCDLIINSGKVSREHAAITRENGQYFMEDLGSSNGTWFDKRRISRRQIQDGDEYFICSEKISCTYR
jgi:FHA domain